MRNMARPFYLLFTNLRVKVFSNSYLWVMARLLTRSVPSFWRWREMEMLCPYTFVFPPLASWLRDYSSSGCPCCLPVLSRNLSPLSSLEGSAPPSQDFWLPWPWLSPTSSPVLCSLFCRQLGRGQHVLMSLHCRDVNPRILCTQFHCVGGLQCFLLPHM